MALTMTLAVMLLAGQATHAEPSTPLVLTILVAIGLLLGAEGFSRLRSNGK